LYIWYDIFLIPDYFKNNPMRLLIYVSTFILGLLSFNNLTELSTYKNSSDALSMDSLDNKQFDIYIENKSQYDPTFLNGLSDQFYSIKLIDNFIVIDKDTTYFPEDLILNKSTVFQGAKGNNKFELTITRINLTTLSYNLQLTDLDNKILNSKKGKAILASTFFLASEIDIDDLTGDHYGSYEYWDSSDDCWFSIRVGMGLDQNRKQRVMLVYGCEDKNKNTLNFGKCPTLRIE